VTTPLGTACSDLGAMQMTKKAHKSKTVKVTLDTEEAAELEKAQKAYPDNPSASETARRLLDMELMRSKRGAR
jgi:hypothetical protein